MANIGTGNTLREAEFSWYQQRSGLAGNAPLGDHQRAYWEAQIGRHEYGLRELEIAWLKGVTSLNTNDLSSLWAAAVGSIGSTPAKDIRENKFVYFKSVST